MKRLALLAVLALSLSGCNAAPAETNSDAKDAVAVEAAFLKALVDGNGEAALALTTLDEDEISCPELISEYADRQIPIILGKAGKAAVDGDTATVGYSYSVSVDTLAIEKVTGKHTLVRDGDSWLIEFPKEYRITATLADDVVGQVGVGATGVGGLDNLACVESNADGPYEQIALPGAYTLITSDPTGVFEQAESGTFVSVSDRPDSGTSRELNYITDNHRDYVAIFVEELLRPYVDRCAASGFTDPDCQDGLPVPTGPVSISDHIQNAGVEVWSTDGATWRFTAGGERYLFAVAGGITEVEMYYTGTIALDASGQIAVTVE